MILSGREIERAVGTDIIIEPFERSKVNPNSYNLTLHNELVYENEILDMKKPNQPKISDSGRRIVTNQISCIWEEQKNLPLPANMYLC